jgi:hypothetical protein
LMKKKKKKGKKKKWYGELHSKTIIL